MATDREQAQDDALRKQEDLQSAIDRGLQHVEQTYGTLNFCTRGQVAEIVATWVINESKQRNGVLV